MVSEQLVREFWLRFKGLPARFQTATASFPEQRDQAKVLLPHRRRESVLKSAKLPIDSLHRLLCLFGDCGAGTSTSSNIELVITFSGEKNWSSITTGLLLVVVGMMLVSVPTAEKGFC